VPISEPPNTPRQIGWFEHGLTSLRGTGLTTNEKISVIMLLGGYVRSTEAMFHGIAEAAAAAATTEDQMMSSYSDVLRTVIDPQRFPSVASAVQEGVFDQADSVEGEFAFGLDRILDGIGVLVRSRT
jgi:hypothetical protein